MSRIRLQALKETLNRVPRTIEEETNKRSSIFCSKVFTKDVQRHYLSKVAYAAVQDAIDHGTRISRDMADPVASAMKSWALELGVQWRNLEVHN